ncbi:SemiSWEET family sugar transporter [Paenibacillus mesotrionivorans]|jgi:MtN3 and saliva related transmembrane protein|uniref:SemiSWEET family sugar transporter n=1 Tax=Paenibacillus mesotrionivorans TaxID=3160968 RepID=A0ACC7NYK4_9BACL
MLFVLFQLIGGVILSFGWIPQIIQMLRTKSAEDLNRNTFLLLFTGIGFMEVYGVHLAMEGVGYAFLITNSMSLVLVVIILALIMKYRRPAEKKNGHRTF